MSLAFAIGVGTKNKNNEWLEVFYAKPVYQPSEALLSAAKEALNYSNGNQAIEATSAMLGSLATALTNGGESEQAAIATAAKTSKSPIVVTILEEDIQSSSTPEVYLKLHLLSHRLVKPHGINLNGMFGLLPNVAWTNKGAVDLNELTQKQLEARLNGELLAVKSVDKFPPMTDYVVPSGVRIAATSRVRLGAYICLLYTSPSPRD